ncbi:MAG: Transposase [Parcubacteria group bacterium GW2011_GWA1_53_13]|nr:MAG: Transposase [Parcubacteria group bacterium GW2011_GWA1_53_13]
MAPNEWYHCYNRGVDKRVVFKTTADYERFLSLLYVCNGTSIIRIAERYDSSFSGILNDADINRGEPLVDIAVYALIPNHVHFILKPKQEKGIALFMQKVFTGYTMYFNKKYGRTGSLFAGTFKSKHIADDRYLKRVVPYTLLNCADLFEKNWRQGEADTKKLEKKLLEYRFSSLPDFYGIERIENKIMGEGIREFYPSAPPLSELLTEARAFYREETVSQG